DAINNVDLIKGGFPARFGGRLSSVLDITMKEGNSKKFSGTGSIGLIASKLTLEGPIQKDKSSFIISARRTYADLIIQPIVKAFEGRSAGYFFYDVNVKVNHKFSDKDRIYLSMYTGG
ncbi:MAG: TonB-dependent receptor, partial [Cyclobacteriaceae bacterium]|nr:TonB-dependent receptor [Cyclobacteriaceae bacterium]